eukprot:166965-Chlamydomonas_euryale.AAC.1
MEVLSSTSHRQGGGAWKCYHRRRTCKEGRAHGRVVIDVAHARKGGAWKCCHRRCTCKEGGHGRRPLRACFVRLPVGAPISACMLCAPAFWRADLCVHAFSLHPVTHLGICHTSGSSLEGAAPSSLEGAALRAPSAHGACACARRVSALVPDGDG